jgi:hypothetical protein
LFAKQSKTPFPTRQQAVQVSIAKTLIRLVKMTDQQTRYVMTVKRSAREDGQRSGLGELGRPE